MSTAIPEANWTAVTVTATITEGAMVDAAAAWGSKAGLGLAPAAAPGGTIGVSLAIRILGISPLLRADGQSFSS